MKPTRQRLAVMVPVDREVGTKKVYWHRIGTGYVKDDHTVLRLDSLPLTQWLYLYPEDDAKAGIEPKSPMAAKPPREPESENP